MKKTYIQLGGAALFLIAAIVVYSIWYNVVSAQSSNVASVTQQVKEKSQTASRVAQARAQLSALAGEEATISQYFISTDSIVPFLEQLAQVGKAFGATVDVVSVSATSGKPYGTITVSLTISGAFDAVMRTLGTIEYGPFDTTIASLNFETAKRPGSGTTWTAAATFTVGTLQQIQTTAPSKPSGTPQAASTRSASPVI